ncbi:MAG: anthranilate synthase component I family protein, partial [Flavobacteriaceae bacterium]
MKYKLNTHYKKILADTITPVSIYLKIRDTFPNSILLESSDYHGNENSFSYVCCNPIANISVKDQTVSEFYPDGSSTELKVDEAHLIPGMIHEFSQKFQTENQNFKFINNGLFGYIGYDAVKYFEDIEIDKKEDDLDIPDIYYAVYQNIIAINHFKNEAYIFSHSYDQNNNIEEIHQLIGNRNFASYAYRNEQDEMSSLSDEEFMEHVELAKKHCFRGDVFQLV